MGDGGAQPPGRRKVGETEDEAAEGRDPGQRLGL
jgi:hypothetical protein